MWELDIIIGYKYRKYLFYIKEYILSSSHYTGHGIFAIIADDSDATMSIAIPSPRVELLSDIRSVIAECIIVCEKERYLYNIANKCNKSYRNAVIKTLTLIDISDDIEYAYQTLDININTINMHSYFQFKMHFLKEKWQKVYTNLLPDNISNENIIHLLKNIIDNNIQKYSIYITCQNGRYTISGHSEKPITAIDESEVISNLILLSPSKILIDNNIFSNDGIMLLLYLFENRLIYNIKS